MKTLLLLLLAMSLYGAERSGPYLGLGYGAGEFKSDGYYVADKPESRSLLRGYGGAFFNSNFSVELDYTHFNGFEGQHSVYGKLEEQFTLLSASALAYYPLFTEKLDGFVKIGAGEITWNESGTTGRSDSAAALLYGAGFALRIVKNVSVRLGVDLAQFSLQDGNNTYDMRLQYGYASLEVQF